MERIPLSQIPNQAFTITLGDKLFDISILLGQNNNMLIAITVDGSVQYQSLACVHAAQIFPPPLNRKMGNMMWLCDDGASYPNYLNFGTTHNLYWWEYSDV